MKVFSLFIIKLIPDENSAIVLSHQENLKHVHFFMKGTIRELVTFLSKEIIKKTEKNKTKSVQHEDYLINSALLETELGLIGSVIVTNLEYPTRVSFSILENSIKEFIKEIDFTKKNEKISNLKKDTNIRSPYLEKMIKDSQDPTKIDKISKVKTEINETVDILKETIEQVFERGIKIESLIEQSNDLSITSKLFYKEAKKQNDCCSFM